MPRGIGHNIMSPFVRNQRNKDPGIKLSPDWQCQGLHNPDPRRQPLDPQAEWDRVKDAWGGDVEAWQRYSGLRIHVES